MAEIPIPDGVPAKALPGTTQSEILKVLEKRGRVRLTELVEEIDTDRADLRDPLVQLVEQGDLALFPVGDSVQVRREG